jgi:hypothetical protein
MPRRSRAILPVLLSSLAACVGEVSGAQPGDPGDEAPMVDDSVGQVYASLSSVPPNAGCVRVRAVNGSDVLEKLTSVGAAAGSVDLDLGYVPIGLVQFSAFAYAAACPASGVPTANPTWLSEPVAQRVVPGVATEVALSLRPFEPTSVGVTFRKTIRKVESNRHGTYVLYTDGSIKTLGIRAGVTASQLPSFPVDDFEHRDGRWCARRGSELFCWGLGPVGDGTTANVATPVLIRNDVTDFAVGMSHSCFVSNRFAMCFGGNEAKQIVLNTDRLLYPHPTTWASANQPQEIVAGDTFTCTRNHQGLVTCWGTQNGSVFRDESWIGGYSAVVDIDAAGQRFVAMRANGTVVALGANAPSVVLPAPAIKVAVNTMATCALLNNGKVNCWGTGGSGALGDGMGLDSAKPVEVFGLTKVVDLFGGTSGEFCAVLQDQSLRCWGSSYDWPNYRHVPVEPAADY